MTYASSTTVTLYMFAHSCLYYYLLSLQTTVLHILFYTLLFFTSFFVSMPLPHNSIVFVFI